MGKSELFSHFADRFEVKRTQAREYFDELNTLAEKELKRSGEFVLPGMVKLVVQKRKARMGRNPATGEAIKIPAKTVVKARIAKQLKDAVLPASKRSARTGAGGRAASLRRAALTRNRYNLQFGPWRRTTRYARAVLVPSPLVSAFSLVPSP